MKKLHICMLICIIALGCSNGVAVPREERSAIEGKKKPKIALIMKSLANEFFSTMAEEARTYQAAHADDFELIVNGIKDERDLSRQVALVEEMVANKVDAIVIAPADSKALISVLRRAQKAGVVVVNIDNRLDAEVLAAENVVIPCIGPDNKAGAKRVGTYLAGHLTKGDKVCIIEGVRTSFNGQQRFDGFQEAMAEAGMNVVSHQSAEWEMSKANTIVASVLSEYPDIKGILAANDSMALGAMAAVKSMNRTGDVLIVGFDNISAVQQAIRDGKILATADQHGGELAVYGIQNALKLLNDPSNVVENVETPVDLVTAESLSK
ncbi:sugar ABC transporter substrate-binding protein [Planctomicrobium sp. SH661]|uniref:sugar ABC transporter substrate-binding protein n=1 Tax=Planctomicrobium sp. SH661 TaxID=3448124 RepID=UPI003F5B78FC